MKSATLLLLLTVPAYAVGVHAAADVAFYAQAAEAGVAEIEAGKLAQQRASTPAIREFAARMVTTHSTVHDELKALARKRGLIVPATPAVADAAKLQVIGTLPGERFDRAYIKGQVADHERMIALLQKEIALGSDKDAQAFAEKLLPDVQGHLETARQIAGKLPQGDTEP